MTMSYYGGNSSITFASIETQYSVAWNGSSTFNETAPSSWKQILEESTSIIITINLILLMTGMGAATDLKEILKNMKKPWGSMIGMICQFGILPVVGLGLSLYFELPNYQAIGVLILCCSPGGAFSNFFAYCLGGDIALSILMTATSSLLAFGGMPLNIWIYSRYWTDHEIQIPYINILISMAFATVPVIVGMLIRYRTRVWANRITKMCSVVGWIGALTSGGFIAAIYWDSFLSVSWNFHIVAALLPLFGFLIPFIIAKILCMNNCISRTVGIETGCQNMVVAMNVMLISFPEPEIRQEMILFPMVYGVAQLVEVSVLIMAYQCYQFVHRNDVTEEIVKSKIDNTVLMKVPTPLQTMAYQRAPSDVLYAGRGWIDNTAERESSNPQKVVPFRKISVISARSETSVTSENSSYIRYGYRSISNDSNRKHDNDYDFYVTNDYTAADPLLQHTNSSFSSSTEASFSHSIPAATISPQPSVFMQINPQHTRRPRQRKENTVAIATKFFSTRERNSPPRSPSMNEGYGFPTFRADDIRND